jgi:hypothetical protein
MDSRDEAFDFGRMKIDEQTRSLFLAYQRRGKSLFLKFLGPWADIPHATPSSRRSAPPLPGDL